MTPACGDDGGGGAGGGDEGDTTTTVNREAADEAAAASANLKVEDFPAGWTSKPHEKLPGEDELAAEIQTCVGIDPASTRVTAEHRSPDFASGLATQASSVILFVKSPQQATGDADAYAGDKFPACAEPGFAKQIQQVAPEGGTVADVKVSKSTFPALGDRTVAHRVTANIKLDQMTVPINIDVVQIFKGRAEVTLTFVNPGAPFTEALAQELASKLVARLP